MGIEQALSQARKRTKVYNILPVYKTFLRIRKRKEQ